MEDGEKIRIISNVVSLSDLNKVAAERFGDMVKAVVDIEKEVMAIGGEMHADEESLLLESGSKQINLWGINIYPALPWPDMVEFDSMINIRPAIGNRSRSVDNEEIKKKIFEVVQKLID